MNAQEPRPDVVLAELRRIEDGSRRWRLEIGDEVKWLPDCSFEDMLSHLRLEWQKQIAAPSC